jgi:Asp-tRNA(Asn)/Glu-tRNA(Gln) amidotransferase C subunit
LDRSVKSWFHTSWVHHIELISHLLFSSGTGETITSQINMHIKFFSEVHGIHVSIVHRGE